MSRKKQDSAHPEEPTPATEMGALREELKLSRADFAEKLGVSKIAVLRWENGDRKPSPETYIKLAKLAQSQNMPDLALRFWGEAGVDIQTLRGIVPELEKSFRQHEKKLRDSAPTLSIPVFSDLGFLQKGSLERAHQTILLTALVPPSAKAVQLQEGWKFGFEAGIHERSAFSPGDVAIVDADRMITPSRSAHASDVEPAIVIIEVSGAGKAQISELWRALSCLNDGIYVGLFRKNHRGEYRHLELLWRSYWTTVALRHSSEPLSSPFELGPGVRVIVPVVQWIKGVSPSKGGSGKGESK